MFTLGLAVGWTVAVYGAALGCEDTSAAWFLPGFSHCVSQNVGPVSPRHQFVLS